MNPSNFTNHPYMSVFWKSEYETVAANIMKILSRTGDTWRKLSWEEYREARKTDGSKLGGWVFHEGEKIYFDDVIDYTDSAEKAQLFSPAWKN